jgi:phospho-N-acetylmuramoyl-pentapeptide-transferase
MFIANAGEVAIFMAGLLGAALGFLWFNAHPAQVFMGDVGSLALGGLIGTAAVLIKHEFLLALIGGVFVVEAVSVLLQIVYFRAAHGQRLFRMAPLHHHFELVGWAESKITVRFWIVEIIFVLLALSTLKIR